MVIGVSLLDGYEKVGEEGLWANLEYFLKEITPVAEANNVKMATHRMIHHGQYLDYQELSTEENLDRFLNLVDSKYNGLTL